MEASLPPHADPATRGLVVSASSRDDDEFRSTRSDPYDSSALSSPGGGEVLSLETVMKDGVSHAAQYEQQLMSLEKNLASELKNIREKIALYKEKKAMVQDHIRSAKRMEELNIPKIGRASAKTLEVVHDVEWKLPGIRSELVEIRKVYDLGRLRAQKLQAEMEWKAKTDFQQWRSTLLGQSPLSPQQVKREWLKLLSRLFLAVLVLVILMYFSWTAIRRS